MWAVIISLIILVIAFLIKHVATEVVEEEHHFWAILGFFFVIYIVAAIGVAFISPKFSALASSDSNQNSDGVVNLDAVQADPQPTAFETFIDAIKVKNVLP